MQNENNDIVLGLFHKAIVQSGSALSPWGLAKKANQKDMNLLGCQSNDKEDVFNFFYKSSAEELVRAQTNFMPVRMIDRNCDNKSAD